MCGKLPVLLGDYYLYDEPPPHTFPLDFLVAVLHPELPSVNFTPCFASVRYFLLIYGLDGGGCTERFDRCVTAHFLGPCAAEVMTLPDA